MCCTRLSATAGPKKSPKIRHLGTVAQLCLAVSTQLRHASTIGKKHLLNRSISPTCPYNMVKFGLLAAQIFSLVWVSRLGSITARHSSTGRQRNFAALNRGRQLDLAGWRSRLALAHILVNLVLALQALQWLNIMDRTILRLAIINVQISNQILHSSFKCFCQSFKSVSQISKLPHVWNLWKPDLRYLTSFINCSVHCILKTRMWANVQRDGRPAEYRWHPLFNAATFSWRALLECRAVMLPRCETRWNLQGCPKLPDRSQPLVGRSSPYCGDLWRRYCCLKVFFSDCRYVP